MRKLRFKESLGGRAIVSLIAGEVAFALVLGATMAGFTGIALSRQRQQTIVQASSVIAATLMPVVADQQEPQVRAQLASILAAARTDDVQSVRIVDASGSLIASTGESSATVSADNGKRSPLSMLFAAQAVDRQITVDGLRLATVHVVFAPPRLAEALSSPILAALLVLVLVILVSTPWTAWIFMRDFVEPLDQVERYAGEIADGRLDAEAPKGAVGEIGRLQDQLARMANQLKERDDRLQTSYADLSRAYDDLGTAKHEIEQLAALKADFVAVAAHELRSPLATISLYAEMLETGVLTRLEGESAEAVEAIRVATTRLGSIVSDLMDSALLERGLMPIQLGEVWLEELVEDAVKAARMTAQAKGIEIRFEDGGSDTVVHGDALRLRQVLDNLLSNAVKYSPESTVVTVRSTVGDGFVDVEVADQGRGVSGADQHVLFTLFGRVDSADGRDTAGLGLGLAISARIAEAHEGSLTFRENEEGRGSVFCMRLPLHASTGVTRTMIRVVGEDA